MKLLTTPIYVPDDFQVPQGCERLEYRFPEKDEAFAIHFNDTFEVCEVRSYGSSSLVAVMPKKYTYDWPDNFKDGTKLKLCSNGWHLYMPNSNVNISYWDLIDAIILAPPPADAPIGTVIVKGEK